MNHTGKDYYSILEVTENASQEEIKAAYRRLAKLYHPDRHAQSELAHLAEERFKLVQEAYDVLGDPQSRERYDQERRRARGQETGGYYSGAADVSRAIEFINARRFWDALDILHAALKTDPESSDLNFYVAFCYAELERWDQALPHALKARDGDPCNAEKQAYVGIAYLGLKRFKEAIDHFKRATELDPREPNWWAWLAAAYSEDGQYLNFQTAIQRLRELDPHHEMVRLYDENRQRQAAQTTTPANDDGECMRFLGALALGMLCGGGDC